ncbi:MAG: hypothetical protein E7536_04825 [Ruminococcaceae bacterium]|nr:hypothetical protein [Oscillospiraceae bacterium]
MKTTKEVNASINRIIKVTGKILLYSVAVFMIVYLVYIALDANYSSVKTEAAIMKTVEKSISTKVFIVRDENYISSDVSGTVVPLVEDGQRVGEGQDIAAVFSNDEDAGKYVELQKINEELDRFKNIEASDKLNIRDISTYDRATNDEFMNLVETIANGNYSEIDNYTYAVRDRETSRQISLGYDVDTSAVISSLNTEASGLSVPEPSYLAADNTGYYINNSDGYENVIDYSVVTELTADQIETALDSDPDESKISNMGKLVNNFNWYIVASVSRNDIDSAKVGDSVKVRFLDSAAEDVNATIAAINSDAEGRVALVIRCNIISADTSQLRIENAEIILETISGYRIPKEALKTLDGINGVYIKRGNLVNFRRVTTLYTGEDYVVVRTYEAETASYANQMDEIAEEERTYTAQLSSRNREEPGWIIEKEDIYSRTKLLQKSYIKLYDEVIVEGKDLYDNKIV